MDDDNVTRFFDLPRWVISDKQIISMEVGRSDAYRVNAVQVLYQLPINATTNDAVRKVQLAGNILKDDYLSGLRDGLRFYCQTVNVEALDATNAGLVAGRWSALAADRLMSGHLRYSGSFLLKGIQENICIGDNLEFNNIVYHIEAVTHTLTTSETGENVFMTSIDVSNGLNKNYTNFYDIWPELQSSVLLSDSESVEAKNTADKGPTGVVE